jgi:hypothetical protein
MLVAHAIFAARHPRGGFEAIARVLEQSLWVVQIVKHVFPNPYSTRPKLQLAIVRYKWHHGIKKALRDFRRVPALRDLTRYPETGQMSWISQNGVVTACKWFVRGVPWHPGCQGGQCAMVNLDQIIDLRNHLRDHGWMHREELTTWLLLRRRERSTPQMEAVLARLPGESVAERIRNAGSGRSEVWELGQSMAEPTRSELEAVQETGRSSRHASTAGGMPLLRCRCSRARSVRWRS